MKETKYIVEMDGQIVARDMILTDAAILIKGLAEEYYEQMKYGGKITLMEEKRVKLIDELLSRAKQECFSRETRDLDSVECIDFDCLEQIAEQLKEKV